MTKYDLTYAETYAALWAFGHDTLHLGGTEGLYRTVVQLGSQLLNNEQATILDFGCGVGRTVADFARTFARSTIYGCDTSPAMLEVASRILGSPHQETNIDLSHRGFGPVSLPKYDFKNIHLWLLESGVDDKLETLKGKCDLILSINVLERVSNLPAYLGQIRMLLSERGSLVVATPCNWETSDRWRLFSARSDIISAVEVGCAVRVQQYFDGLPYIETLDRHGSCEFYSIFILGASR